MDFMIVIAIIVWLYIIVFVLPEALLNLAITLRTKHNILKELKKQGGKEDER